METMAASSYMVHPRLVIALDASPLHAHARTEANALKEFNCEPFGGGKIGGIRLLRIIEELVLYTGEPGKPSMVQKGGGLHLPVGNSPDGGGEGV